MVRAGVLLVALSSTLLIQIQTRPSGAESNFYFGHNVPTILDGKQKEVNVERVAEEICAIGNDVASSRGFMNAFSFSRTKQVSRPSTIVKLSDFFHKMLEQPEAWEEKKRLLECARNNKSFLTKLKELLQASRGNVCASEKLLLIGEIHRRYISTAVGDQQLSPEVQPGAVSNSLRLFFMHYAMEVSAICKLGLINNLEWDLKEIGFKDEYYDLNNRALVRIIEAMERSLSAMTSVDNYDDVIIIWDVIDGFLSGDQDEREPRELDERTGEEIKMYVKTGNSQPLLQLQERCRAKFRPIYEKLILPIITLADIGYSCDGERFEKEIRELQGNKLVREWYILTQICESLLPIKFVQDKNIELTTAKVVIITKEEADELTETQEQPEVERETVIEYEPITNIFASRDYLESVESVEANRLVQRVKLNINSRNNGIKRILKRFLKQSLEFSSSKINIFFSRGQRDNAPLNIMEHFGEAVVNVSDDVLLTARGASRHHLTKQIERKKRHNRIGDVTREMRDANKEIDHMHTKHLTTVWNELYVNFNNILPGRFKLLVILSTIVIIIVQVIVISAVFLLIAGSPTRPSFPQRPLQQPITRIEMSSLVQPLFVREDLNLASCSQD